MKKVALAGAGLLLAAGLAACGGSSHPSTSSSVGSGSGGTFTTIDEAGKITAGAPDNPYNLSGNSYDGYNQVELGYTGYNASDPNQVIPAVAQSWSLSGRTLTVHIQPKAGWSDGTPVTANDVMVSTALDFADAKAQAADIGTVKVVNSKTIQFNQAPGPVDPLFTEEVLTTITVVQAKQWSHLLPSDIWSVIVASEYAGTNKAKTTAAAAATKTLTAIGTKVSDYNPKPYDITAGPFYLKRINPGAAILLKNPYFWDASAIVPSEVEMRNYTGGNTQIWGYLKSGQLDTAPYVSTPTDVLKQILAVKGNQALTSVSYVAAALAFDEADYPYNLVAVRQALDYLLNKQQITTVGEGASGKPDIYNTGMVDSIVASQVSPATMKQLTIYNVNTAKATSLLDSVGFKKNGSTWDMPNGKPFKISLETVSGFSDWIAASAFISKEWDAFGIQTTVNTASDFATYQTDIAAHDYSVGFWLTALGPAVSQAFVRIWGPDDGYNPAGTSVVHSPYSAVGKGNWLDTPTTYTLPGVGTFNPGVLTQDLNTTPFSQQQPIVDKLALASNKLVPMIALWDYVNVNFVNTTRFVDYPAGKGGLLVNPPGVWMWNGYVKKA